MSVPGRIASLLVAWAAVAAPALAQPASELPATLKRLYPGTAFDAVASSPMPGLSEVVMGTNVAYVDGSGRYFLFGRLFDMQTQRDLTAERIEQLSAIDFGVLPLEAAIKSVRGTGSRILAVFSDPDCPHCRTLEHALATLDDVTVYTFLYPVEALHPGARDKAIAVWCAPDRPKAWSDLMLRGAAPPPGFLQPPDRPHRSRSARASGSSVRRRSSRATAGERSAPNPRRSSTRGCARPLSRHAESTR